MNTAFLSNPAPDSGYNSVMAALAPHSAPAEGSLGGTAPSVHNRVKQTFINPVATYPFLVRRWQEGWERGFHPGDLMFIYNKDTPSARTVVLANLPTLNHIMAADDMSTEYQDPLNWTYIGVMRNSAVASGRHPTGTKPRGGNSFSAERIINIDVRGSTRMFNYWEKAEPGKHVYLVWRKMLLDTRYTRDSNRVFPNGDSDAAMKLTDDDPSNKEVYQLLPYTKGHNFPQDRIFWNNDASVHHTRKFERPIRVGFVFQGIGNGELSYEHIAIRKATRLAEDRFKLPMLNCFVHV